MPSTELSRHPRLYIGPQAIERLRAGTSIPFLQAAARRLDADCAQFVTSPAFDWERNTHNAHLLRARIQQKRVMALLVQWVRTNDAQFRKGAIAHMREMAGWEYWSWLTWRENNPAPDAIFDLSYGENAATLAVAWDLLHDTLTPPERDLMLGMARKWIVPAFLKHTEAGHEAWWYQPPAYKSNWLAVCAGGAGLVALAMYEHIPEATEMLERVRGGVTKFMRSLTATGGGWTEGVIYWNYGMRYAFMFLLSQERALQNRDPLFDMPEVRATLRFPLDFAPGGKTCAFGDIGDMDWQPIALHYAAAERVGASDVLAALDALPHDKFEDEWATVPELLALHPGQTTKPAAGQAGPLVRLYPGLYWGMMADRWPDPAFYLSIRGGVTSDPHNSADLLSWHCLVHGERLVSSLTNLEYLDTTFSNRRFELTELRADTKNAILVSGVGMAQPGTSQTSLTTVDGCPGIRIDATAAYRIGATPDPVGPFVGRLFLLIEGACVLIVDRIELAHANRIETRMHTYARLLTQEHSAVIEGKGGAVLQVSLAATLPCCVATSLTTPTNPKDLQAHVLRWATVALHEAVTFATLLVPGTSAADVSITEQDHAMAIAIQAGPLQRRLTIPNRLGPAGP